MTNSSRRQFLRAAGRVLLGGALADCRRGTAAPSPSGRERSVDVSALVADGQSLVTRERGPDGAPILVVRSSAQSYAALSMQCTHEGCPLNPPSGEFLICPCHGSRFDLQGRVLAGPAEFPLARYVSRYDGRTRRLVVMLGG